MGGRGWVSFGIPVIPESHERSIGFVVFGVRGWKVSLRREGALEVKGIDHRTGVFYDSLKNPPPQKKKEKKTSLEGQCREYYLPCFFFGGGS